MKFDKILLAAALILGSSMPMMAQFSNDDGSKSLFSSNQEVPSHFNRITLGYDASFIGYGGLSLTFSGFAVRYVHGWALSKRYPLYIDAGLKMNMNFCKLYSWSYKILSTAVRRNFSERGLID